MKRGMNIDYDVFLKVRQQRDEFEKQLKESLLLYNNQTSTITSLQDRIRELEKENERLVALLARLSL